MLIKWTFIAFGIAAIALFVLSKLLAFMNPARPARAGSTTDPPRLLRKVERALRWTLLVPLALAAVLLVLALSGIP
jgi:hypothetical protein